MEPSNRFTFLFLCVLLMLTLTVSSHGQANDPEATAAIASARISLDAARPINVNTAQPGQMTIIRSARP
jgi:hypothetical protein